MGAYRLLDEPKIRALMKPLLRVHADEVDVVCD